MSLLSVENFCFRYEKTEKNILQDICFAVEPGEFVVLCGPSGSGKSTLLRSIKPSLSPVGVQSGTICFEGTEIVKLDGKIQGSDIGFVMQQPDSQIVTDKVWHEMAFGLENMGLDQGTIERRIAETAAYFGIQNWFHKNTDSLSGGQKQLLNLAAIMVMRPKLLILDEPISRLDPVAARDFIETIGRLNREMGMAVLIAEHNLEEVFALCDRVIVLDEGKIYYEGSPKDTGEYLAKKRHVCSLSMPAPMRIYAACQDEQECPVSVKEGHEWLDKYAQSHTMRSIPGKKEHGNHIELRMELLTAKEVWFRYPGEENDVLRGTSFRLYTGKWHAILGGNGSGKSTLLKVLAGQVAPWRGKVKRDKRIRLSYLSQEPKQMFRGFTVAEELSGAESDEIWEDVVKSCRLGELLERHPYDLSGGEAQRAALAKLLLTQPDILLLDEPTKGLDAENKRIFADIIRNLCEKGCAVLMVSHDLEFCAEYADYCSMLFDGKLQCEGSPRFFCADNHFYTTAAHRMAAHLLPEAVTASDVIYACGGQEAKVDPPNISMPPKREKEKEKAGMFQKLPCSECKIGMDLSLILLPVLLGVTLFVSTFIFRTRNYMAVSMILLAEILVCFFSSFERKRPGAREIALIAILCALGCAGRGAFFMLPQFKPVAALVILCGAAYGPKSGFLVGAGTMLASNLFFGQGPWTPWQMCAMGGIGFFSGFLFRKSACRLLLSLWGGIAVFLIYGFIMNISSAIMYQSNLNWMMITSYIVSGIPFDAIHGVSTILFLWILSEEFLKKMHRIKIKFNLQMG